MRRLIPSAALAIASVALLLLVLEVAVRLFVPDARWRFLDATADWELDAELGWVNRPNIDATSQTQYGTVRFRTNRDGLVPGDAERAKPTGAVRVMLFGDSMLVGRLVAQDAIYAARLAALLREKGIAAEVISAGVQGYSTDQALLLMRRWVPVYQPDLVVYGSTLNDYGGNALSHAYQQEKPVFRLDAQNRLRLALPQLAPEVRRYGRGPRVWLQQSALYRLLQPAIFLLRARMFGLEQRILLGTEQGVYIGDATASALDWALYEALVVDMERTAEASGARFLFFAHPEVGEVWEPYIETVCERLGVPRSAYDPFKMEARLAALAQRRGLDFLATIQAFRDAAARGPFHFVPIDAHLNRAGHELLAELLAEHIAEEFARGSARR